MKTIYNALITELKTKVTELNWVDLDRGQIDYYESKPPIAYPCVLVEGVLDPCESIYTKAQQCTASLTVRVIQNPYASESGSMPTEAQAQHRTKQCYELIDKVYATLQGLETGRFSPLSRISQKKETRQDGLFVYKIEFQTMFDDLTT